MKLSIQPTGELTLVDGVPCRRWTGIDQDGVPVEVLVRCIQPQSRDPAVEARYAEQLRSIGLAQPTIADGLLIRWFGGGKNGG